CRIPDGHPGSGGWPSDRGSPDPFRGWSSARSRPATSSDPDGCLNQGFADEAGSTKMINPITVTAGIDTGKKFLDIALHPGGETLQVPNDAAGHRRLTAWLASHAVERIGIEASGGYERTV